MGQRRLYLLRAWSGEGPQPCSELRACDRGRLRRAESRQAPKDLDDGRVACALRVGLAAPLQPAHPVRQAVTEVDLEPRLADAGLADDEHHLAPTPTQLVHAATQGRALPVTADDGG